MILEVTIRNLLHERLAKLEKEFTADCLFYYGEIHSAALQPFRDRIEELKKSNTPQTRLVIFLNTSGGSAETTEKFVEIIRQKYTEVYFVVPDAAMSAGTMFCMSGDRIYMDYSSSLGPIDPQVWNGKQYVPALGYLDKVEALLAKAAAGTLLNAEFLILQNQDLAMLSRYEQARNLTVTLLKKWLVEYKFKNWTTHQTTPTKLGQPVTNEEKEARAEEVANILGDHRRWHSHGRMISIEQLRRDVKLKIEDYTNIPALQSLIRQYNDLVIDHIARNNYGQFMHTRHFL